MELKCKQVLFDRDEFVCAGTIYSKDVISVSSMRLNEFYCVNPLDGFVNHRDESEKPSRADFNVSKFRNWIFEMDELDLEDQLKLLKACEIPWSLVTYSGGKSYHAVLSLSEPISGCHTLEGIIRYKEIWKRLEAKINASAAELGLTADAVVDTSSKNPSRFTRMPGFKAENRKKQELIEDLSSFKRISKPDFEILLESCPYVEQKYISPIQHNYAETEEEFWIKASEGLKNSLKFPTWIKGSSNNYSEILRVTLWAIDETLIPYDNFIEIYNKHVIRYLRKYGYPEEKWYVAVDHAYRSKGML